MLLALMLRKGCRLQWIMEQSNIRIHLWATIVWQYIHEIFCWASHPDFKIQEVPPPYHTMAQIDWLSCWWLMFCLPRLWKTTTHLLTCPNDARCVGRAYARPTIILCQHCKLQQIPTIRTKSSCWVKYTCYPGGSCTQGSHLFCTMAQTLPMDQEESRRCRSQRDMHKAIKFTMIHYKRGATQSQMPNCSCYYWKI